MTSVTQHPIYHTITTLMIVYYSRTKTVRVAGYRPCARCMSEEKDMEIR